MDIVPKGMGAMKQQIVDMTTAQMKTNLELDRFGKNLTKNQDLYKNLFKQQILSQQAQARVNKTLEDYKKSAQYDVIAQEQGKLVAGTTKLHDKLTGLKGAVDPFVGAATLGFGLVTAKVLGTVSVFNPAAFDRFTWAGKDLAAVLGEMLVPTLEKMTFFVRSVADWIVNLSPETKKLVGQFATFTLAGTATFIALSKLITVGTALTGVVKGLAMSFTTLSMSTGGLLTLAAVVASIAVGWKAAKTEIKDYVNESDRLKQKKEIDERIEKLEARIKGGVKGVNPLEWANLPSLRKDLSNLKAEKEKLSSTGMAASGASFAGIEEVGRRAQISAFSSGKSSAEQTADSTRSTAASVVAILELIQRVEGRVSSGEATRLAQQALQGLR